jgi:hypothetical protein
MKKENAIVRVGEVGLKWGFATFGIVCVLEATQNLSEKG